MVKRLGEADLDGIRGRWNRRGRGFGDVLFNGAGSEDEFREVKKRGVTRYSCKQWGERGP